MVDTESHDNALLCVNINSNKKRLFTFLIEEMDSSLAVNGSGSSSPRLRRGPERREIPGNAG